MAGTRVNLADKVHSLLKADTALKTLTGADASDPRVYQAFGGKEQRDTSTKAGFVTIFTRTPTRPFLDREEVEIQVTAHAESLNRCRNMADRFDAVLHNRASLAATGWTDISVARTSERPAWDDAGRIWQLDVFYSVRAYS